MSEIKLVVIYPTPTNVDEFERLYTDEHLPFAGARLFGQTKAMVTTMVSTPDGGEPPFYKMFEAYFPSQEDFEKWATSSGAEDTVKHAVDISTATGTKPIMMVATEVVP